MTQQIDYCQISPGLKHYIEELCGQVEREEMDARSAFFRLAGYVTESLQKVEVETREDLEQTVDCLAGWLRDVVQDTSKNKDACTWCNKEIQWNGCRWQHTSIPNDYLHEHPATPRRRTQWQRP